MRVITVKQNNPVSILERPRYNSTTQHNIARLNNPPADDTHQSTHVCES